MKKSLLIFLIASMLFVTVSCSGTDRSGNVTDSSQVTADSASTEAAETVPEYSKDSLIKENFDGAAFTILTGAEQWANKYDAEDETGDILNDAVYARNRAVEEAYNIDLEYFIVNGYTAGIKNVTEMLYSSTMAGDAEYDLYAACAVYTPVNILNGSFSNLLDKELLDFSAPWWYHNVNDTVRVNDKLYIAAGSFGLQTLANNWCIIMNSEMQEAMSLTDPYGLVHDGKWTFDRMVEMSKSVTADINGDGNIDRNDRWGIVGTNLEPFWAFPFGMGRTLTTTDSQGNLIPSGTSERIVGIMDKLTVMYEAKDILFKSDTTDPQEACVPMFVSGNSLMMVYPLKILETSSMREAPDFKVLPLPKYDEDQEEYYTNCFADTASIPIVVKDDKMSQIVLEALNCYTYFDVIDIYKELVMQNKLTRDNESAEMLDIIIDGTIIDFGAIFYTEINTPYLYVNQIIESENYNTWWAANGEAITLKLKAITETIANLP